MNVLFSETDCPPSVVSGAILWQNLSVDELSHEDIARAVAQALEEDVGTGDVTTLATVPAEAQASALMRAREDLVAAAQGKLDVASLLARRRGPSVLHRALPPVPTRVSVDNRASQRFTVVDVRGEDRVGLLHDLAAALATARLEIAVAKVATEANRAIDSFYVTRAGRKLTDPDDVDAVRARLASAVVAPSVEG